MSLHVKKSNQISVLVNNNSQSNHPMKLNNNQRLITPNKVTATVSVIGEPNHHYNHTVSFYNVRTTVKPLNVIITEC